MMTLFDPWVELGEVGGRFGEGFRGGCGLSIE